MPGNLVSERFNGGGDGVAITTGNSSIGAVVNGTPAFETGDGPPIEGSACMKCSMTALTSVRWDFTNSGNTPLYIQGYVYLSANPSATGHVVASVQQTTTTRAQIRRSTNGAFDLRNVSTNVWTGAAITAGQWVRYRWKLDWGAGVQSLDLFYGANLHGSTPSESSGNQTLTNATRDRITMGTVAGPSATSGSYQLVDYFDISDTAFEAPFSGLTPVSKTLQLKWHVKAAISDALQLKWHVRQQITDSLILRWGVRTSVGKALQLRWNVRQKIIDAITFLWNTQSLTSKISKNFTLLWGTRKRIYTISEGNSRLQIYWGVRKKVSTSFVVRWSVRTKIAAGKVFVYRWRVRQRVSKSLTLRWDTNGGVTPWWDVAPDVQSWTEVPPDSQSWTEQ